MNILKPKTALTLAALGCLAACGATSTAPEVAGYGAAPPLPEPTKSLLTTVNIAPARGFGADDRPEAVGGFAVNAFARDLDHPRWIYVLPNGDVLVAEADAPAVHDQAGGPITRLVSWARKQVMKRAGAGVPSPNKIILLRAASGGVAAQTRTVLIDGLNSPFGMALVGNDLYVADTDALLRFPYVPGETVITSLGVKVADLPAGPIDHHWTKNIIASADGTHLFITVGSNSNAAENGIDVEADRARILDFDIKAAKARVFATGLRNANGMSWQPQTAELWAAVNERDDLGNDLVPDYMTAVHDGAFYGWPYSYYGSHVDTRVKPQRPDLVAKATVPDYALGNHTASLGLTFYSATLFPQHYRNGAFVGQHGSWNRKPRTGYKVVFVPFANGKPSGPPEDFLTGFLDSDGNAKGRPVGVAVDRDGALLVADDVGNAIWRVVPTKTNAP
ncbi:sorbosone dehydrogenase family protein [Caballeronia sp. SBC2]|uniref:PQQ-dependent sugar dehydrogenase n=1 Tax=Caballeronia sp. SBC2 TaxID=2705547 RepID=UPI0013E19BB6|nr:sorbosone dehydrogenase family protein [Caballeronia sp. SBC2]QIE29557.1 Glucose / Sorbosone dehydrogenase [Caballeronia sp. SBC2]